MDLVVDVLANLVLEQEEKEFHKLQLGALCIDGFEELLADHAADIRIVFFWVLELAFIGAWTAFAKD